MMSCLSRIVCYEEGFGFNAEWLRVLMQTTGSLVIT